MYYEPSDGSAWKDADALLQFAQVGHSLESTNKSNTSLVSQIPKKRGRPKGSTTYRRGNIRKYSCSKCSFSSNYKQSLRRHEKSHVSENNGALACTHCSFICTQKLELSTHMKDVHNMLMASSESDGNTSDDRSMVKRCVFCNLACPSESTLQLHMRTHNPEKPYECNVCGYHCSDNNRLTVHLRTHTGEKPFGCPLCSYRSNQKSNVKTHMRTHTADKCFPCPHCLYKAKNQSGLAAHVRTHAEEEQDDCQTPPTNSSSLNISNAVTASVAREPVVLSSSGSASSSKDLTLLKPSTKANFPEFKIPKADALGMYNCPSCKFKSTKKEEYSLHSLEHQGVSCQICNEECSDKEILAEHMKTHAGGPGDGRLAFHVRSRFQTSRKRDYSEISSTTQSDADSDQLSSLVGPFADRNVLAHIEDLKRSIYKRRAAAVAFNEKSMRAIQEQTFVVINCMNSISAMLEKSVHIARIAANQRGMQQGMQPFNSQHQPRPQQQLTQHQFNVPSMAVLLQRQQLQAQQQMLQRGMPFAPQPQQQQAAQFIPVLQQQKPQQQQPQQPQPQQQQQQQQQPPM